MGFGMSSSIPIQYYVSFWFQSKIFIFNENWSYASNKSAFNYAAYMVLINNYFYITGEYNIWKTDQQLNILRQYNSTGSMGYRGLYCNSTNDLMYVAPYYLQVIQVFNLNLTLTDNITISPYRPWSINGYNNQIYVGTYYNATILVIDHKQIIKQFNACNGQNTNIFSILFDAYDNMVTGCSNNQLYLYNTNGSYLSKNITTVNIPRCIQYDSKSRLVVVTSNQILLYN